MGFSKRNNLLLILSSLILLLPKLGRASLDIVCVHVKDCPQLFPFFHTEEGKAKVRQLYCALDGRYHKVWCRIPCLTSLNEEGYCNASCSENGSGIEHSLCEVSSSEFVCCPKNESTNNNQKPTPEITTESIKYSSTVETNVIESRLSQPDADKCGIQADTDKIINGKIASMNDHPWTALLQYKENGKLKFKCGGSLISNKFVLTAAHCVHRTRPAELLNVVLGEYNTSTELDCFHGHCMPKPLSIKIKDVIVHPDWLAAERPFYDDIALIELEHRVDYNEYIRPICLSSVSVAVNDQLTVAGWGRTEFNASSEVKRVAIVDVQSRSTCLRTISLPLKDSQLCVGGSSTDSCNGDSGGPLMKVDYSGLQPTWYLVGVVSLGRGKCGSIGKPGIYTNVPYYYDWIMTKLKGAT